MKKTGIICLMIALTGNVLAQENPLLVFTGKKRFKVKKYNITLVEGPSARYKGKLSGMSDTSLILLSRPEGGEKVNLSFDYKRIQAIEITHRNTVIGPLCGMALGFGVGLIISGSTGGPKSASYMGGMIGYSLFGGTPPAQPDYTAENTIMIVSPILGALLGYGLEMLVKRRVRLRINGDLQDYLRNKSFLEPFVTASR
jgi:hypothetical protein